MNLSSQEPLRIAVLGDPHFYSKESNGSRSSLKTSTSHNIIGSTPNPWEDLKHLIDKEKLTADILVCVGDITFQADQEALTYGWKEICTLGESLHTEWIIATAGNHDVLSRQNLGFNKKAQADPIALLENIQGLFEPLKQLDPPFPIVKRLGQKWTAEKEHRHFFGDGFAYQETENFLMLSLNSCIDHSYFPGDSERGMFPKSTEKALRQCLLKAPKKLYNILVVHHPILPRSESGANDYTARGDLIAPILEAHSSNWLIIHGHKHFPDISYAPGGSDAPVVFSAASVGAAGNTVDNEFYILDLHLEPTTNNLRGLVQSWKWNIGTSWGKILLTIGENVQPIYNNCGFGYQEKAIPLANKIAEYVNKKFQASNKHEELPWMELLDVIQDLKYLMPRDIKKLITNLENNHNLVVRNNIITPKV